MIVCEEYLARHPVNSRYGSGVAVCSRLTRLCSVELPRFTNDTAVSTDKLPEGPVSFGGGPAAARRSVEVLATFGRVSSTMFADAGETVSVCGMFGVGSADVIRGRQFANELNVTELIVYSYPLSRAPALCLECGNTVRLWPGSNRK